MVFMRSVFFLRIFVFENTNIMSFERRYIGVLMYGHIVHSLFRFTKSEFLKSEKV